MARMSVTTAILLLLSDEYANLSPREVNSGQCEEFQQSVIMLVGRDQAHEMCTESLYSGGCTDPRIVGLPGHCWIYSGGLHFDAEAPNGVDHWTDLPIFKR